MGLVKKDADGADKAEPEPEEEMPKPEDPPIIKKLKEIDDKYLELQKEYEREAHKLLLKYTEKQKPVLEERRKTLLEADGEADGDAPTGTPAVTGFWRLAMQNHPIFDEVIQEWDEPVLDFLEDIECIIPELSEDDSLDTSKQFKLIFKFASNPYFENTTLEKEYNMAMENPYCGQVEVKSITCSTINWKSGKDVTVEKVAKKVKGGGAKKAKAKKGGKEEARPSFFRDFFRPLSADTKLSEDAKQLAMELAEEEEDEDMDDEQMLAYLMDNDYEIGTALRDYIIPFAVRWYTGEASPDDDDDDEEEEEEEEEDDEDDDEEESDDDDVPPRGRGRRGPPPKKDGGKKKSPEIKPAEMPKEECKQQ